MKQIYKDAKISLRLNSELLEDVKTEADELNLTLSDYINKILLERKQANQIEARFKTLENAVFGKTTQAA